MADRRKLTLGAAVFVAVFLLGFVPQCREARRLGAGLETVHREVRSLQWEIRLAQLRDQAGAVYLETNRKNYGIARQHSSRFFDHARELLRETSDPGLKGLLESVLQQRDPIIAGLTRGDGSVQERIEKLYAEIHERAKAPR